MLASSEGVIAVAGQPEARRNATVKGTSRTAILRTPTYTKPRTIHRSILSAVVVCYKKGKRFRPQKN
jgi:hypothetical protein